MRNETFYDVAQNWLTITRARVAFTTFAEYERALQRYFLPRYRLYVISHITYEELSLYLATIHVSGKTFNNIMIPLRGVFQYAKRVGVISNDVTELIETRRYQKPAPDPLEPEEVFSLIQHLQVNAESVWLDYFQFAIFSGIRPSEQIALTWDAVDFRRSQVRISQARVRAQVKSTKTQMLRYVDLQSKAEEALSRRRTRQSINRLEGYIFVNPATNRPFASTEYPLRIWSQALKDAGIRPRGAKQSRHTFATMCLHAGMNPAYVSRQMGHSNAKMFFEVYSRWIDGSANHREKAKMDAYLTANCL